VGGMAAAQGTSVASVSAAWRRCALPCQRPITALKAVTSSSIMPVSLSRSSSALASTDRTSSSTSRYFRLPMVRLAHHCDERGTHGRRCRALAAPMIAGGALACQPPSCTSLCCTRTTPDVLEFHISPTGDYALANARDPGRRTLLASGPRGDGSPPRLSFSASKQSRECAGACTKSVPALLSSVADIVKVCLSVIG
jgi:hypothetical protein